MLEVRLQGGLTLRWNGADLALPTSRRARAVLAFLALHPGPHSRARLAARFWPDVLDESARTSLRVALTELRRALGPAAAHVVATRETVALDGAGLDVDVRRFAVALDAGDAAAALAACRQPILDGFDDDWAHAARDTHSQRLAEALEQLAAAASEPGEAVALTREQVALDPLGEAANRRLIARLAAAGDRAAALSAGRQFADRLRVTLQIAPSSETRALLAELRQETPAPPPRRSVRHYETEFVGRTDPLLSLRTAWDYVSSGRRRRLVLVAGEPGIGKTRLAHQFTTEALDPQVTVIMGRCSAEPLAAFEPFAEALAQAGREDALDRTEGDALAAEVGDRYRLFDRLDAAFSALAPLALVLDDLHWADRGTLLLMSFMLRSTRPGPMLLIGTYRDTEISRQSPLAGELGELQRAGALDRISLRGLELRDVAQLSRALVGSDAAASSVHARTGGNAFFVEEILKGLGESEAGALPESARHAVGVRLAAISDAAVDLLAAGAVLGLEHDARALPVTAHLPAERAEAALDEVVRARLLRPAGAAWRFEFTHALVRETVLHELNALRRARLHRQAAAALSALGEERYLEEIALHRFEAASIADAREAAELLVRAGRRALQQLAYERAAERFARALEALELAGTFDDDAGPVLLARGDALLKAGAPAAARAVFGVARELALRRRDPALLGAAALGYSGLGIAIVSLDEDAVARLEEALAETQDQSLRARLQARLAIELYYAPDRSRSEALSAQAVANAADSGDGHAVVSALNARHVALWRPDRVAERLEVTEAMIAAAREAGDRHAELQARNWRVADLFELGDTPACREEIARHVRLADDLRLPGYQWYGPLWAGVAALLAGRYAQAERLIAQAREAGSRAGDPNAALFAKMLEFVGQAQRREFAAVDLAFVEDKLANSPAGPAYQASYAWILAEQGEAERARVELDIAMAHDPPFDANWLSHQAEAVEACALLGHAEHAATLYERMAPYAGRPVTAGRAVGSYGAADRHLGMLAALAGRRDQARDHLRTAIRRNDELGCVAWRARSEVTLAALTR